MRGKAFGNLMVVNEKGITPAHAGKSFSGKIPSSL